MGPPAESPAVSGFLSPSARTTGSLGRALGAALRPGDVVRLSGELGSGKTRFVKGLAEGLGAARAADVVSPTFLRIEEYGEGPSRLRHVDAYRMAGSAELDHLGAGDVLAADAVLVVEWPERIDDALPPTGLRIRFLHSGPGARTLSWEGLDPRGEDLAGVLDGAVRRRRKGRP